MVKIHIRNHSIEKIETTGTQKLNQVKHQATPKAMALIYIPPGRYFPESMIERMMQVFV